MEPIQIIATTYFPPTSDGNRRASIAADVIESWNEDLVCGSNLLRLHIADDGSDKVIFRDFADVINSDSQWGDRLTFSRQERRGVGASLNAGIFKAPVHQNLFAYFVDDWLLNQELDLEPWAKLLEEDETIGMVRLGPPHPGIKGIAECPPAGWVFRLERHHFAFSFRPFLAHRRFFDYYGPFTELTSSLECERLYNDNFCRDTNGPDIVYAIPDLWTPLALDIVLSEITPTGVPDDVYRLSKREV